MCVCNGLFLGNLVVRNSQMSATKVSSFYGNSNRESVNFSKIRQNKVRWKELRQEITRIKEGKSSRLPFFAVHTLASADHEAVVGTTLVHASTLAILPELAIGTWFQLAHPRTVAKHLEPLLPHLPEIVTIDVALMIVGTDTGTRRDGAIDEHRGHRDARIAMIEMWTHLPFVLTQEALTTIVAKQRRTPCLVVGTLLGNELHQSFKLLVGDNHLGVGGGTSHRKNGEQSPVLHPFGQQHLTHLLQVGIVATSDACIDIPSQSARATEKANGSYGAVVASLASSHPVMVVAQTVQADGEAQHASRQEFAQLLLVQQPAVGHDAPRETSVTKRPTYFRQVGTNQRLASRDDHHDLMRIDVWQEGIDRTEEIFGWHVGAQGRRLAIATTMAAMEVTSQGTLPEKLPHGMNLGSIPTHPPIERHLQALTPSEVGDDAHLILWLLVSTSG